MVTAQSFIAGVGALDSTKLIKKVPLVKSNLVLLILDGFPDKPDVFSYLPILSIQELDLS